MNILPKGLEIASKDIMSKIVGLAIMDILSQGLEIASKDMLSKSRVMTWR